MVQPKPQHPHHHYLLTLTAPTNPHLTPPSFPSDHATGDGQLQYNEFMNMLQSTKTSVLTTKVLTQRGEGGKGVPPLRPGREIH